MRRALGFVSRARNVMADFIFVLVIVGAFALLALAAKGAEKL